MAEKFYKVDEAIELGYQAPNKQSGQTIIAEIYLPNKQKDSGFPDVTLDEIGNSGTYRGSFTPNEQGTWQVIMHKSDGDGQVTKSYSVGAHNVHTVGEAITTVDGKADAINIGMAKDATVAKDSSVAKAAALAVVDGKVDNLDTEIDEANAKLNTVDTKLDDIDNKVSALDTPPMAF